MAGNDGLDFTELQAWHDANLSADAADHKPDSLIEWLERIKPHRVKHIEDFLAWRETALFRGARTADGDNGGGNGVADDEILRRATDIATAGGVNDASFRQVVESVPESQRAGFAEWLAWLSVQRRGINVPPLLLFLAYAVLARNTSLANFFSRDAFARNMDRGRWGIRRAAARGAAVAAEAVFVSLPTWALIKLGLVTTNRKLSDEYIEKQIRALRRFQTDKTPDESHPESWLAMADERGLDTAPPLRRVMMFHAHRVNSALSRISAGVKDLEMRDPILDAEEFGPALEINDNQPVFNDRLLKPLRDDYDKVLSAFKEHRDDLRTVMQAAVDLMLVLLQDDLEDLFSKTIRWLGGNLPDLEGIRKMYDDMRKNPYVDYSPDHALPYGAALQPGSVKWNDAYGGEYGELLDRIKSLSLTGDSQAPQDDLERTVVRLVESTMDPSQMFLPIPPLLTSLLTYTMKAETMWGVITAFRDNGTLPEIEIAAGTIVVLDVRNLRRLVSRAGGDLLETAALSWKTTPDDGGGSQVDEEFELINPDGKYDGDDRLDGEGRLVIDDMDSAMTMSAKTRAGAVIGPFELMSFVGGGGLASMARDYLRWTEGGETGPPPDSEVSMDLLGIRSLLEREETKRRAVMPLLLLAQDIRKDVIKGITGEDPKGVDFARLAARDAFREEAIDSAVVNAALAEARGSAEAAIRGERYESTFDEATREPRGRRRGRERERKWPGRDMARRGAEWMRERAREAGTGLKEATDPVLGIEVRSPVCQADGTEPTELQKLTKKAIDTADRYLAEQYKMFGLWGLFNIMLVAVMFYLLWKMWEVLFQYYQFRRQASRSVGTPNSNNIFDPADDNVRWEDDPAELAKMRVPSGAAIESRLRRLSRESGTDVSEALDSSKDKYPKKRGADAADADADDE